MGGLFTSRLGGADREGVSGSQGGETCVPGAREAGSGGDYRQLGTASSDEGTAGCFICGNDRSVGKTQT